VYASAFIYRTSFVIDGERYFSLFDDAMVSMRYASNLAHGHGAVWNPGGERVEGYTNPLWVLTMAGAHLLPLPASKVSLVVQIAGAMALLLNLVVTARLTSRLTGGSRLAVGTALLLTASYLPLNNWGLQGLEVGPLALLVTASAWLAVDGLERGSVPRRLYLLLGLGTLIRLDMLVAGLAVLGALVVADPAHRRRHILWGLGVLLLCLGGQTMLRWWYYGDLLPNTYYLKMTGYPVGYRLSRGAIVLVKVLVRLAIGLSLLLPSLVLLRPDRRVGLLMALIAGQAAYSVYVGGDAWEWAGGSNRYLAIVMPILFVLVAVGIARAHARSDRPREFAWAMAGSAVGTVVLLNLATNDSLRGVALLDPPMAVADNAKKVATARFLRAITRPTATVAVVWAGAEPYFMGRQTIDLLGKNDRVIARRPMRLPPDTVSSLTAYTFFLPGHLKWDYAYSIGQLRPDVVAELWSDGRVFAGWSAPEGGPERYTESREAEPFLAGVYQAADFQGTRLYVRRDSRNVRWALVQPYLAARHEAAGR
jgi:hypothetical protein